MSYKTWFLGFAASVATLLHAVEPWAVWTNFTGADATDGLAPQASSTQNGIDGGTWRLKLGSGSSVTGGGVISTGTGSAVKIDLGQTIDFGYNGTPITLLITLRNCAETTGKPIWVYGTSGKTIGATISAIDKSAGTASIRGVWNDALWNNNNGPARAVNALAGSDAVTLAFTNVATSATGGIQPYTVSGTAVTALGQWTGLKVGSTSSSVISFGNTESGTEGGLDYEILQIAIYRGEKPPDLDLRNHSSRVYTWQGTSTTFHSGPWDLSSTWALDTSLGSTSGNTNAWKVFASNQTQYGAPGTILRFVAKSGTVVNGNLDASFSPLSFGGLIVESGATGYALTGSNNNGRLTELGASDASTAFIFHEDFTIDRSSNAVATRTTTFYGTAAVAVDSGKTFTITKEAAVDGAAAVTLSGGGTLACSAGVTVNGTLTVEAGTLSGAVALNNGTLGLGGTAQTLTALTGTGSVTATAETAQLTVPDLDLSAIAVDERITLAVSGRLTLGETAQTLKLASLPTTLNLANVQQWGLGDHPLLICEGATDEQWAAMAVENLPAGVTVSRAGATYTVTVGQTVPLTWMAWGDSITEGESSEVSYRHALWNQLAAAGYDVTAVGLRNTTHDQVQTTEPWSWHNAWYGATVMPIRHGVTSLYLNLDTALEAGGYPDLITVMIGTNDAASYTGTRGTQDLDARFAEWRTFIERMAKLRPHSQIIVATPPKLRSNRAENLHTLIQGYRDRIVAAKDAGASPFNLSNVAFVDMWSEAVLEDADYVSDGTHPSASGCEKIAAVWFSAIEQVLGTDGVKADLAIAEVFNSDATTVQVRLNKPVTLTEGATATLTGTEVTLSNLTLSADGRVVTATASADLPLCTALELTLTGAQSVQVGTETAPLTATFTALGSGAAANIPDAYRTGFKHRKTVDLAADYTAATDIAEQDGVDAAEALSAIRRVAYYLELQRAGSPAQFVWVSMEAFDSEARMGVPTAARGVHQREVKHLQVYGNRGNFTNTTADATDVRGLIEFTPYTYNGTANAKTATEELYTGAFDWRDTLFTSGDGYGCMQVAQITGDGLVGPTWAPAKVLFAFNGFNSSSAADLGIGSFNTNLSASSGSVTQTYDWTYATSSGIAGIAPGAYTVRKLEIWVEPGEPLTWGGAAAGEWNTADGLVWTENKAFVAGDSVTFGALTEGTSATITVPEALMASTLDVTQNAYTFSGAGSLTATTLTLAENASAIFNLPLTASSATIGANGTLTVKSLEGLSNIPGGSGTFVYDGGKGNTLTLGHTSANTPKVTVESGTLVIPTANSTSVSGSFNPVYTVKSGATLQWSGHDLVGWGRSNTVTVAEISGVLEKTGTASNMNETFSGRLLLKDGGELRNSGNADYLMLHNSAVIEVEKGDSAKLTGNSFKSNNGTPILRVGQGATLTVEAPINLAAPLKKEGTGEWVQAQNGLSGAATLTVSEGRLTIERQGGSRIWVASPIVVNEGATLNIRKEVQKDSGATTINGTLTGDGLFYTSAAAASLSITASGRIVPTGALTLQVTGGVSVAPGATIVANGNKLTCTNGLSLSSEGTITIEVPSAAPFSLEPTEIISNIGSLTADNFTAPTGYTLAKTEAGALTLALTPPPKPEQGEGAAADTTEWTTEAAQAILTLTQGTVPTTINATTKGGAQALTAAEASAALAVFQHIAEATADGATVTVTYDFGISDLSPSGTEIEVIAEVRSGDAAAEVTEGTTLSLVLEGEATPIEGVTFAPVAGQAGKYRALVPPAKLSKPFKVRATR
ncbi:MAG: GDSL-type esterase/lipase family protein [Candidatus Spyradenecus sp.]